MHTTIFSLQSHKKNAAVKLLDKEIKWLKNAKLGWGQADMTIDNGVDYMTFDMLFTYMDFNMHVYSVLQQSCHQFLLVT